jgi:outer membrane protein OmpA-like peptidoglycan-associated protein
LNRYGAVDSNGINYTVELGKYRNVSGFDSTKFKGLGTIKSRQDNDGNTIFYIDSVHTLIDAEKIKYKAMTHDSLIKNADIIINNKGHRENFDQFYHTGYNKGKDSLATAKVEKHIQSSLATADSTKPTIPVPKKYTSNYDSTTRIGNIYYDFDKSDIVDTAKKVLNQIIKMMNTDLCVEIDIYSFTDSRGTFDYNLTLSQNRANSAISYLVSKGIDSKRIKGKGLGKTQLINDCGNSGIHCSEADYALNRRTEFKIVRRAGCK